MVNYMGVGVDVGFVNLVVCIVFMIGKMVVVSM